MNQQYPQQPGQPNQPNQPQQPGQPYPPQQPGWGGPQQPGYGAPGFGGPVPQPPKKSNTGKFIGFGCLGVVALVVLIAIIGAIGSSGGGSDDSTDKPAVAQQDDKPAAEEKDDAKAKDDKKAGEEKKAKEEAAEEAPVKVTAKKTNFAKSIIAPDSDYTSVLVTVTNASDDTISVNPLYFTITDTDGTKHTAELGVDEKQIDTVELAPGENVSGNVTGQGGFTPKYVTYTDGLLGDSLRADVS
ncbi:DUF4352 domain-containing protein [Streptomyces sp. CRN 30]|uniref:DUF4352 domain-containing protein n=1 Tax=Streptomyces sp. CRN 30 TaxID=3075613 RepID=UPI002A83EC3C|nr:DUF4352 domain-containing protein [Streptomyces sp. CRN 30]